MAGRLAETTIKGILHLRRTLRMTSAAIAATLGLARAGLGLLARIDPPEPVRRCQPERPGTMIHIDIKRLGRIDHPGHQVTGHRRGRIRGAGWDFVHVEVPGDDRKTTPTAFLLPALRWFGAHGIRAERVDR